MLIGGNIWYFLSRWYLWCLYDGWVVSLKFIFIFCFCDKCNEFENFLEIYFILLWVFWCVFCCNMSIFCVVFYVWGCNCKDICWWLCLFFKIFFNVKVLYFFEIVNCLFFESRFVCSLFMKEFVGLFFVVK